ncbi:FKBP-type peptidyl-prolyl cis-trans isomerase [Deinococcus sp. Marseille-Q6407]|uniref:FKBP-type peptidyl-prolyl cis-trans isomerase n=1 Tax=Deinococcus sp. Marseille-Q6407 TaxID=2969223 RepID=UPI0021BFBA03|nr:FKBP-type peptidyl-prolyl cis-trans isomerase [Deinococcus sp. Marseille-Q6407]
MSQELKIDKHQEGTGAQAQKGDVVSVHYTGRLENGQKFDSSHDRGEPIQFVLGAGQVIAGWDQGIEGMRVGDQATLTIPSDLAYGLRGVPGVIPGGATLIFDVELVNTRRG